MEETFNKEWEAELRERMKLKPKRKIANIDDISELTESMMLSPVKSVSFIKELKPVLIKSDLPEFVKKITEP